MMLLEHDAKALLGWHAIVCPEGVLADSADVAPAFAPPWVVKAQVPVGGRGKAGGVVVVQTPEALCAQLHRLIGTRIGGHQVRECRIEQVVSGGECYLGLMLDPATALVNVLVSERGGIDVETSSQHGNMLRASARFDLAAVVDELDTLSTQLSAPASTAVREAGRRLATAFFQREMVLVEINPLFVSPDGTWVAGDAKVVTDDNAIERQPSLLELVKTRDAAYPDVRRKLDCGFDFVRLDPEGDVGLVTTGAGLSMQLVDELTRRGCRPYNFCDIRTGQFRGNPARLVQALGWMTEGANMKAIMMNFFAGVTDLEELAGLILQALDQSPSLNVPVVIRLIGNRFDAAQRILSMSPRGLRVEPDLERAIEQVIGFVRPIAAAGT